LQLQPLPLPEIHHHHQHLHHGDDHDGNENFVHYLQPSLSVFELLLDASADITKLTTAVQSKSCAVEEIHVDIYESFSNRWNEEEEEESVTGLFTALGQVPRLSKITFYGLRIFPYKFPIAMVERTLAGAVAHLHEFQLVGVCLVGNRRQWTDFSNTLMKGHATLKSFTLDNCCLRDESSGPTLDEAIIQVLVQMSLKRIVIRATDSRMWGTLRSASVGRLCGSTTLVSLDLHVFVHDPRGSTTTTALAEMATFLMQASNTSRLTSLSVSGSLAGPKGANTIAQVISTNTRLKSLELHLRSRTEDDDDAIIQLSRALAKNKTLTKFQLHGATNTLGSRNARRAYLEMLQTNFTLQKTVMVFHPEFLQPHSEYYAKLNRMGRGRLLENNSAGRVEWVDMLIKVKDDLDCLYYFLKARPILCSTWTPNETSKKIKLRQSREKVIPVEAEEDDHNDILVSSRQRKRLRTQRTTAENVACFDDSNKQDI